MLAVLNVVDEGSERWWDGGGRGDGHAAAIVQADVLPCGSVALAYFMLVGRPDVRWRMHGRGRERGWLRLSFWSDSDGRGFRPGAIAGSEGNRWAKHPTLSVADDE